MSILEITEREKEKIIKGSLVKNIRKGIVLLMVAQLLLGFLVIEDPFTQAGLLIILPVAFYLIPLGYRFGYVWLIVFRLVDFFGYWLEDGQVPYGVVAVGIAFICLYFYGFKIETNRIRLQKAGEIPSKKKHTIRDSIIAVLIFVLFTFLALVWLEMMDALGYIEGIE